jgi:hypothetical protein
MLSDHLEIYYLRRKKGENKRYKEKRKEETKTAKEERK